jgi:hypothetical protein
MWWQPCERAYTASATVRLPWAARDASFRPYRRIGKDPEAAVLPPQEPARPPKANRNSSRNLCRVVDREK